MWCRILISIAFANGTEWAEEMVCSTKPFAISLADHNKMCSSVEKASVSTIEKLVISNADFREFAESQQWIQVTQWYRKKSYLSLPTFFSYWKNDNHNPILTDLGDGFNSPQEEWRYFAKIILQVYYKKVPEALNLCLFPRRLRVLKTQLGISRDWYACPKLKERMTNDIELYSPIDQSPVAYDPMDPENVIGFELLYATPGDDEMAEIAGHLLLRIKLKSDSTYAQGQNPNDLVVAFLADTQTKGPQVLPLQVERKECTEKKWYEASDNSDMGFTMMFDSTWQALKGLSGGFLTTFDRQTLYQTIYQYTIVQDRNLVRYELTLSDSLKRKLLEQIVVAKINYKTKYFFFDRNCASVLVDVISQGIDLDLRESFDPIVAAPNVLIGQLVRHGYAKRVYPTILSMRSQGYIAFDEFVELSKIYVDSFDYETLQVRSEEVRLEAYKSFLPVMNDKTTNETRYKILNLIYKSEWAFIEPKPGCDNVLTDVQALVRSELNELMRNRDLKLASKDTTASVFSDSEAGSVNVFRYSGLHQLSLGLNFAKENKENSQSTHLCFNVFRQDMLDFYEFRMEPMTSVSLGAMSLDYDYNNGSLRTLDLSMLSIRKFRSRLNAVPSIWEPTSRVGIGLDVLKYEKDPSSSKTQSEVFTGYLLYNIIESQEFLQYGYLSHGLSLGFQENIIDSEKSWSLGLPFGVHFGSRLGESWMLRGNFEFWLRFLENRERYEAYSTNIKLEHTFDKGQYNMELNLFGKLINKKASRGVGVALTRRWH